MAAENFLADLDLRPLRIEDSGPLEPIGLAIGPGSGGLEVAVVRSGRQPGQETMRHAWRVRQGGRAAPVLLVALYANRAAVSGPGRRTALNDSPRCCWSASSNLPIT
jgi:hypothetical protein